MAFSYHFKRAVTDEIGQDLAEYGITLAMIGFGAGLAAVAVAGNVSALWSTAVSSVAAVVAR